MRSGWETFGEWQIHGGAGGTRARREDLEEYARVVSATARRVAAAASLVTGASRWTIDEFATPFGTPFGAAASVSAFAPEPLGGRLRAGQISAEEALLQWGRQRLREIAYGPDGLVSVSRRLRGLAGHLHRTTRAYEAADLAVAATFDALVRSVGSVAGAITARTLFPVAAGALLLRPMSATPHPEAVQGLLAVTPGFASGLVFGSLPGAAAVPVPGGPRDLAQLAALITRLAAVSPWLRETRTVSVTPRQVPVRRRTPPGPPRGVGDVMDALALTYHGPGVVRIERITGPDGQRSWLVAVPGVQTWGAVAGRNPFDLTSAVGTMAGRRSAPAVEVARALEAVGAGRDEPVLLAGHSLGGMVACGLAADPAFRARFRVTHVVTAGSPVALFRVPPSVRVLTLEHDEDVVPSLDGRDNPDRATWVSVRGAASADPTTRALAAGDPYVGHDIAAYARTATRLDRSDPALLHGWREGFDRFAMLGSTVRVWEFRGER